MGSLRSIRWSWQARAVLLSAIWGTSFLFIKVGDRSFAPFDVASVRIAIGALILVGLLVVSRHPLPRGLRLWGHLAVAGLLLNAVPFTLIAWGEVRIPSLAAGIWNATTPLFVFPVSLVMLSFEKATWAKVTGLFVGFVGVVIVLGAWSGLSGGHLSGDLACLSASACYGLGMPYARRFITRSSASPTGLAAGQLIAATVEMALVAPWLAKVPLHVSTVSVLSVLALGAFGTGVAYVINYSIIREAGATNASLVTYLITIFSTVLGITVLGEVLVWNEPVGAIVVLLGVAISQGGFTRARSEAGSRRGQSIPVSSDEPPPDPAAIPLPLPTSATSELTRIDEAACDDLHRSRGARDPR